MLEREGGGEERGRHLRGIAIFFKDLERTGLSPSFRPGHQVAPVSAEFYRRCAHLHPPIRRKQFPSTNGFHRLPPDSRPQTLLKDFRSRAWQLSFLSSSVAHRSMEKIAKLWSARAANYLK